MRSARRLLGSPPCLQRRRYSCKPRTGVVHMQIPLHQARASNLGDASGGSTMSTLRITRTMEAPLHSPRADP